MGNDRVQITYDLNFTTLFHFGTGIRAGLIDRTVVRDGEGYLYVPGSTIKGVLREHCEQLARIYKHQLSSPHNEKAALYELGTLPPSLVTRIFGSHVTSGTLYFENAVLEEEDKPRSDHPRPRIREKYREMQVDLYTQVRLNRLTRTSVPGALYTSEFGTNESVFHGSIEGWLNCTSLDGLGTPAPSYSLLLLLAGMRMIDRLGGNKSTGKGACSCDITSIRLKGQEIAPQVWSGWLAHVGRLAEFDAQGREK